MPRRAVLLALALALAPVGGRAADLVVWWEKGFYPQEDEAIREVVEAFEQDSGKQVELGLHPQDELVGDIAASLEAGHSPDFAFGLELSLHIAGWAFDNRLVDLTDSVGHFSDLFDPDALEQMLLLNASTGQKAMYALPVGRSSNHVHVWKSLLERAGFTLADIPREWEAFWSFWCDQVQPAVRRATRRDDIWGVGLNMSVNTETMVQFFQFVAAYGANYVSEDGALLIDEPEVRRKLVKAIDSYTAVYRRGCTPPSAVAWGTSTAENNALFLAQAVVMTPNETLSIPNALRRERPDDYYKNAATIDWPLGPSGDPFPIWGDVFPAVVFEDGGHVAAAEEFVRFLVGEGWLAHYLNFSAERMLPSMSALLDQPFWLDPSDPHHMAAVMQISARPLLHDYATASGNWRHQLVEKEWVWPKAVHRVAAEGISPGQAVDEAIARIKEILGE